MQQLHNQLTSQMFKSDPDFHIYKIIFMHRNKNGQSIWHSLCGGTLPFPCLNGCM